MIWELEQKYPQKMPPNLIKVGKYKLLLNLIQSNKFLL